jgi:hypothetical protein
MPDVQTVPVPSASGRSTIMRPDATCGRLRRTRRACSRS